MTKSVNGKIWQQKNIKENYVIELCRVFEISDLLARILSTRTIQLDEALHFLSPKIKNLLPDPMHLFDMEKAIERTVRAITEKQKICIFADYDVDGATSSALLKNVFRDLGVEVDIYVPDRIIEGYGPNKQAMGLIKDKKTDLVITVDCGAMAHDALSHAKELGLDVIVIDHHISTDSLPEAVAVINPNRIDENSEYKYLAAVGVSFLFVTALTSRLKKDNYFKTKTPPNLMDYLDLVALGTVCDVMLLTGLNRAFVSQGLKVMQKHQNLGLKTLFDIANLEEKPNCYHLGFILGPRINAGGRVGKAFLGANLLSTTCAQEAIRLAQELEKHNNERKVIEEVIINEAIRLAEDQQEASSLFIVGEGWHPGVIGIVAGKLKEKFNKPTAVIALNDGIGKASCRSIKGIDFGAKIIEAKNLDLVIAGGGHAMAAGFSAEQSKLPKLKKFLNSLFENDFKKLENYGVEEYNGHLSTNSITFNLIDDLSKLEPYGNGNPEPIFRFSDLFVLKADIIGGKHIKCLLAPDKESYSSKAISAIAFNAVGSAIEKILLSKKSHTIEIIGFLKLNNWRDRKTIQIQIKDIIL